MLAPHKLIWWVGGRRGENQIFFLQGCKSNQIFYRGENQKWHILQGWKTLLTLILKKIIFLQLFC